MIEQDHPQFSVRRQCELIGLNRSTLYYQSCGESAFNLQLMRLIDEQYLMTPFYGWPRMTVCLQRGGCSINHKRVRCLMRIMGLQAIYPKPKTSMASRGHKVYPYLLKGLGITRINRVWCADISYVPMQHGFMYLVAIMDWYSGYVLAWRLSNTLDGAFCLEASHQALQCGKPDFFNTDQGAQSTAQAFVRCLETAGIRVSMDARGRALDNVFVERLWCTVKCEDIYLKDYASVLELDAGLCTYFRFYNHERSHQSLEYRTPAEVHFDGVDLLDGAADPPYYGQLVV
jgi:putative transposase